MKNILVALAAALAPACAFAQAIPFKTDSGYKSSLLFSVSRSTGGFDYDSAGDVFYIGGSAANAADTQVVDATKASGYGTRSPIVDYGSASSPVSTYGSFVTVKGSEVYYGDSVHGANGDGNVNGSSTAIITPTPGPSPIANMPDNFDLVFSGNTAFVSADIQGAASFSPENSVYTLNLSTGKYQDILDTGDYSGPIAATSSGELIYGKSGYTGGGGIYIFSKASVQKAISSGKPLALSDASKVISNSGNGAFALGPDNELFSAFTPTNGDATVSMYDLLNGDSTPIGSVTNEGYYFSGMQYFDGDLTLAETDGASFTDFIDLAAVPEPGSLPLGAAGLLLLAVFHRKRPLRASR